MLHPTGVSDYVRQLKVRLDSPATVQCRFFYLDNASLSYTWINQERKSVYLPAPTYIDYVMTWVQNLLDDETVFPTKSGMSSELSPQKFRD
jgi:hypothetical protein